MKIKHGHTYVGRISPEYRAYMHAKSRCENPNVDTYKHYGGRGIKFKFKSFKEFLAAVGPKPEPKEMYWLDREDNDGHYAWGNVRWITRSESAKNKRPMSQETRDKISRVQKGKKMSPEACKRSADGHRGLKYKTKNSLDNVSSEA